MKVLIDDGLSTLVNPTGVGQQCLGLYKHISSLVETRLTNYRKLLWMPKVVRRLSYLLVVNTPTVLNRYDVVHYINFYTPVNFSRAKKIVTIHDLGMFFFPELLDARYRAYIQKAVQSSVTRADLIITPSCSVRNELLSMFRDLKNQKVRVCFNGVRSMFLDPGKRQQVSPNVPSSPYFLFVGTIDYRKQIHLLVDAFIKAKEQYAIDKEYLLVLIGTKGRGFAEFERKITLRNDILHLGYVNENDLYGYYVHAKAFIFPSLYEGFGIPLLEAMSCKIPIICSDISTNTELDRRHNSQMFIFRKDSMSSLAELLKEVGTNSDSIRKRLNYGDLSVYNFDNVARKHLEAYQSLF
jgi:glycosyltransferase involved in cell wall biosynthesis